MALTSCQQLKEVLTTFAPLIPAATDSLSQSQSDIQTNFTQLNNIFQINHVEYNNAAVADRGKHKQINLRAAALPVTIAGEGALYVFNTGGAREQLRYRRESNGQEFGLTEWFGGAVRFSGAGVILGGSVFNVAGVVRNAVGRYTITFAIPLTSPDYVALATNESPNIISSYNVSTTAHLATGLQLACKTLANAYVDPTSISVLILGEIS